MSRPNNKIVSYKLVRENQQQDEEEIPNWLLEGVEPNLIDGTKKLWMAIRHHVEIGPNEEIIYSAPPLVGSSTIELFNWFLTTTKKVQ
ncbi:MAG: hypothetical protein GY820_01925 [Gammaproteobacteria bacterium]|nr:hypothetical protein [Gammaproteobacteria bacterium]